MPAHSKHYVHRMHQRPRLNNAHIHQDVHPSALICATSASKAPPSPQTQLRKPSNGPFSPPSHCPFHTFSPSIAHATPESIPGAYLNAHLPPICEKRAETSERPGNSSKYRRRTMDRSIVQSIAESAKRTNNARSTIRRRNSNRAAAASFRRRRSGTSEPRGQSTVTGLRRPFASPTPSHRIACNSIPGGGTTHAIFNRGAPGPRRAVA